VTAEEFGEVDIDLLADYVGGALDGTREHEVVATRVAADPAWQRAHADLVAAMTAVEADLRAYGSATEPMPAELAAFLDEAFSASTATASTAPTTTETSPATTAATPATTAAAVAGQTLGSDRTVDDDRATEPVAGGGFGEAGPAAADGDLGSPGRRLTAVPGGASGPVRAVPKKARSVPKRWVKPMAIAAGLVAFAGFGVDYLNTHGAGSGSTANKSAAGEDRQPMVAEAPPPAAAGAMAALPPANAIGSSGTDYRRATLASAQAKGQMVPEWQDESTAPAPAVNDPLARLRPQTALLACLVAIADANGAGPITALSVDYARYNASPAVIVRFTAANGSWAWASGAACGSSGADASTLGTARVG